MFVCPKCGYKDSPCWRASKYHPFAVQTTIDELVVWELELARDLKEQTRLDRTPYHYRLTRSGRVYRMPIEFKTMYYHGKYSEKYRPPLPAGQTRIFDKEG